MKEALTIIGILFSIIFCTITLLRIILTIIFRRLINKYKNLLRLLKNKMNFNKESNSQSNKEDKLFREKNLEIKKAKNLATVVKINQERDVLNDFNISENKTKIVGIVKPIGKWTSLILGQKVSYLIQQANQLKQQNDAGYWTNMTKAHATSKSKEKGQGR